MEQTTLTNEILVRLRSEGVLSENEVAFAEGDLYVAKNVITGEKRILQIEHILSESKRTLLKG